MTATHPYFPPEVAIPGYAPNVTNISVLLGAFAYLLLGSITIAVIIAKRWNPTLSSIDTTVFCWFVLCGTLHCFFEGYFVTFHADLVQRQDIFAQLWKEYALSDSRYLTGDVFTLIAESLTVVVFGPMCFATAVSIALQSTLRHQLQIITCTAHLVSVTLYYCTNFFELQAGISYSRPEFLYFWVYFIGFNLPWVIVPLLLLTDSVRTISRSLAALEKIEKTLGKTELAKLQGNEPKKTK